MIEIVATHAVVPVQQTVPLLEARGRVLASSVHSAIDVPPFDNSAVDGYALRSADSRLASLTVVGRIAAGDPAPDEPLEAGTAIRLFTGAPLPPGADCVVMQEDVDLDGSDLVPARVKSGTLLPGSNVRPKAQDIASGNTVLEAGQLLQPRHLGLLASIGQHSVPVFERLKVGLLSTGDELVEPGWPLQPGQIYNSNRYLLTSWLQSIGCNVIDYGIIADTPEASISCLERASREADLVISTGGMSVGEEDHIKAAVEQLGELGFWKIRMKPGKPLAFGLLGKHRKIPFLGIPGNPGAAFVSSLVFARPLISWLQGRGVSESSPDRRLQMLRPRAERLPAAFTRDKPSIRRDFLRARIENGRIAPFDNQSSGMLMSACWAEGLAVVPEYDSVAEGQLLDFYRLGSFDDS
ncbi:molybdopterin molybdotransferase MoeA [Allohahella marinimesophila]|uniref:Molybdopterin molybdenumtransferase n=2 Tax=Allohahella marinimesophila TaxID=1054972 RepID=A0ABP7NMI7_9GAMM